MTQQGVRDRPPQARGLSTGTGSGPHNQPGHIDVGMLYNSTPTALPPADEPHLPRAGPRETCCWRLRAISCRLASVPAPRYGSHAGVEYGGLQPLSTCRPLPTHLQATFGCNARPAAPNVPPALNVRPGRSAAPAADRCGGGDPMQALWRVSASAAVYCGTGLAQAACDAGKAPGSLVTFALGVLGVYRPRAYSGRTAFVPGVLCAVHLCASRKNSCTGSGVMMLAGRHRTHSACAAHTTRVCPAHGTPRALWSCRLPRRQSVFARNISQHKQILYTGARWPRSAPPQVNQWVGGAGNNRAV
jgi:hypothetical protein